MVGASLFRRLLGDGIDTLPQAVRQVHDASDDIIMVGSADVWVNPNPLAGLLCRIMRLPAAGQEVPVRIAFLKRGEGECWQRTFGSRSYASRLDAEAGVLVERMGPAVSRFQLSTSQGSLHLDLIGFRFLGLRLPRALRPTCHAIEGEQDGAFTFDIPVSLPWLGPVIRYAGRLAPLRKATS